MNTDTKQNGRVNLNDLHNIVHQGSSLLHISEQCRATHPRPPSHHPSNLTSVYLVPALHLLLPSSPFYAIRFSSILSTCPTISILFDPLYSPTFFLCQRFYAPLHFELHPSATLTQNFSNTSSLELSLSVNIV